MGRQSRKNEFSSITSHWGLRRVLGTRHPRCSHGVRICIAVHYPHFVRRMVGHTFWVCLASFDANFINMSDSVLTLLLNGGQGYLCRRPPFVDPLPSSSLLNFTPFLVSLCMLFASAFLLASGGLSLVSQICKFALTSSKMQLSSIQRSSRSRTQFCPVNVEPMHRSLIIVNSFESLCCEFQTLRYVSTLCCCADGYLFQLLMGMGCLLCVDFSVYHRVWSSDVKASGCPPPPYFHHHLQQRID